MGHWTGREESEDYVARAFCMGGEDYVGCRDRQGRELCGPFIQKGRTMWGAEPLTSKSGGRILIVWFVQPSVLEARSAWAIWMGRENYVGLAMFFQAIDFHKLTPSSHHFALFHTNNQVLYWKNITSPLALITPLNLLIVYYATT